MTATDGGPVVVRGVALGHIVLLRAERPDLPMAVPDGYTYVGVAQAFPP